MNLVREYTREIITFVGIGLMCFVYNDFRLLVSQQADTAAHTVDVLRSMDARLQHIETNCLSYSRPHSHEN